MMLEHLRRMARYNRWANRRLYVACAALPDADYLAERPAFFGSIHGTLNHLIVADRIWLARLRNEPFPGYRLDDRPYAEIESLRAAREAEDDRVIATIDGDDEAAINGDLVYRLVTAPQAEMRTPRHLCWLHLFNHQTHHRGQIHGLLSQTAVAPPPLDLLFYLREAGTAVT